MKQTDFKMKKSIGTKMKACPSPVWCVGTYDENGQPNIMTASWAGICCSEPPALAVSLRKATYTYHCIVDSKSFTVNIPSQQYIKEADYFGIASGRNINKFEATGLTAVKAEHVNAPYVEEFPLVIECRLIHTIEIGLHTQFIGEVIDIKAEENILMDNGMADILKIDPFLYATSNRKYYGIGKDLGIIYKMGDQWHKGR